MELWKSEGWTSAEIYRDRRAWSIYRDGAPGGETPDEVSDRADHLILSLNTSHGNVAVFTHGQFAAALAVRWIGLPVVTAEHFMLGTASLSILAYSPSHPNVRVIALWNALPSVLKPGG